MNKGMYSSKRDDWETPREFFDKLNLEFGFNTDVCATKRNAQVPMFFSPEENGLVQDWAGNCFMNPPYGREIGRWVKKAFEESKKKYCRLVVGLLPARTDTRWFNEYIYGKAEIRFLKGRLKFGGGQNNAPFPSMIVIWKD